MMKDCYNSTMHETSFSIADDDIKASDWSLLGQTLSDTMSCPTYVLVILMLAQLFIHLIVKNKKNQQSRFGKRWILNITLTLLLTFLLSWKMTYEETNIEIGKTQNSTKLFSTRNQIITYALVAFHAMLEMRKLSNNSLTLFLFWLSMLSSLSINLYHDLKDGALGGRSIIFWIDLLQIVIVLLQCCLLRFPRKAKEPEEKSTLSLHPQERSSWLSDLTLFWTLDLFTKGWKKELQESDVYDLAPKDQCRNSVSKFELNLKVGELVKKLDNEHLKNMKREENNTENEALVKEKDNSSQLNYARVSLLSILMKTYGVKYICIQSIKTLLDLTHFIHPLLIKMFMDYIGNRENEHWTRGVAIVCFLFVWDATMTIFHHRHWGTILRFGKQLRASITLGVFNKALSMRNEANKDTTTGEIVNLISDDCDRVVDLSEDLCQLLTSPLNVFIAMYLLYDLVGSAMLVGLCIIVLLVPLNRYVGRKMKALYTERDEAKEKRTKLMNEIINGIKVLKLYAWENSFMEKVKEIRRKEEECHNSISFLSACIDSMFRAIPFLVKLGSLGVYIFLGGYLDPAKGFMAMRLFHVLNHPFSLMPLLIPRFVEAASALKRIEKFINGEDIPTDNVIRKNKTFSNSAAISISEGEFTWEGNSEKNTLRGINLDIPKGSLVAIVGIVGSGKSSLLSAMLGEMEKVKGHVEVRGKTAYVPQEAWILNAPLKDNVLFGSAVDDSWYKRVVNACALKHDIDMMKAGDKTEIGEKGINLSGGQKQRVSLARALYNDADVFLLDDPLSAVDAHVGKHIFNKVIGNKGLLQGKTRVLVTHGLHWLPQVDSILVLKNGEISESGTYEQLLSHNGAFAQFARNILQNSSETKIHQKMLKALNSLDLAANHEFKNDHNVNGVPVSNVSENSSSDISITDDSANEVDDIEIDEESVITNTDGKNGTLIDDEELEEGQVDKKVYLEYIKVIGYKAVILFVLLALTTSIFDSYNSYTIKEWTDDPLLNNASLAHTQEYNETKWNHFMLFAVSGAIEVIAAFLFVITILSQSFQAATRLHSNLLYRVLRCPMSFFDTTPSCRIITRFSKDVSRVDGLGGCFEMLIKCSSNMLIFLFMIIINCPTIVYFLVPITIAYYLLFKYHIGSIRQLRRFGSKYRSPMFSHFTETINGLSSIRAYSCQKKFVKNMETHIDEFVKFSLMEHWASLGLGLRSSMLHNMIVFGTGLICVFDSSMTAGLVGLVISFASSFTGTMNRFCWTVTHAETEIISLERLIEYLNKPSEAEWDIEETKPAVEWSSKGHVSFNSYKARYREGLDLVLKGVDCQFQSGEKVGIVGRTGAGKTSLTMAFFRLLEAADGSISVDDETISDLGLHDLRSRINILPQDPVIFSGTLRMNLDPFNKHSDEELWTALNRSHLESFVKTLPGGLEFECGEGGKNLSVGQRQLLCLARTLLRKTKILVLDEATAAVDMETDELIQKTIRSEFQECTVLTIAHRLNTILDYDKILVLEFGKVKEFDSPSNLLANSDSIFYSMAKDAKLV